MTPFPKVKKFMKNSKSSMSPQFFSGIQNHRFIKPVVLTMLFENFSTNSLNFYAILFYIIYKLGFILLFTVYPY